MREIYEMKSALYVEIHNSTSQLSPESPSDLVYNCSPRIQCNERNVA